MNPQMAVKTRRSRQPDAEAVCPNVYPIGISVFDDSEQNSEWIVEDKLDGDITYLARNNKGDNHYRGHFVIKLANNDETNKVLENEIKFYKETDVILQKLKLCLPESNHRYTEVEYKIPNYIASGVYICGVKACNFLILQRMGADRVEFFSEKNRNCTTFLGTEMVKCLEFLHKMDYVHGSINPFNILYKPLANGSNSVVLCEFGRSQKYRNEGKFCEKNVECRNWYGVPAFMSRDSHRGWFSRRGDVEAVVYLIIFKLTGSLPWIKGNEELLDKGRGVVTGFTPVYGDIYEQKQELIKNPDNLDKYCPTGMTIQDIKIAKDLLRFVGAMNFQDCPNYDEFRNILQQFWPKPFKKSDSITLQRYTRKRHRGDDLAEAENAAPKRCRMEREHDTLIAESSKSMMKSVEMLATADTNMQKTRTLEVNGFDDDVEYEDVLATSQGQFGSGTTQGELNCDTPQDQIAGTSNETQISGTSNELQSEITSQSTSSSIEINAQPSAAQPNKMPKIVARTPKVSDPHWCRELISKEVQVTDRAKGEWMVREHLAEGGYAHLHTVSKGRCPNKLRNRSKYVIKSERCDEKNGTLSVETKFFKDVCTSKPINGLPPYVASGEYISPGGKSLNRKFLIMPKYDSDLFNFRVRSGGKFDTKLAASFAMKTLDVLEQIHKNGYLHRDVKENNILINFPTQLRSDFELVICDFGLVQPINGKKIGSRSPAQGTKEYAGLDAHKSKYGRVGDLISLCYCVIEWLGGSLPWMQLTGVITWERIFPKKEKFMKDLGKKTRSVKDAEGVSIIKKCLRYLHTLEYDAIPDYGKCRGMFNELVPQNVVPTQFKARAMTGDNNIIQEAQVPQRPNRKRAVEHAKKLPDNSIDAPVERKRYRRHIPNAGTHINTAAECSRFAQTQANPIAACRRQLTMVEFQPNKNAGCIQQQVQEAMPSTSRMTLRSMAKKLQNQEPRTVPYNLRSRKQHINVPATTTTSNNRSNKNRSPVLQPPEVNTRSVPKRPRKPNNVAPQNPIASPAAGADGIRTNAKVQQPSRIIGKKNDRIRACN